MTFSKALEQMKKGKRAKRASWRGDSLIFISYPRADRPQFRVDRSASGTGHNPDERWVCDAAHAVAEDWLVV